MDKLSIINSFKQDNELIYLDNEHQYFYENKSLISVTTFISKVLFTPFNEVEISEIIALKTKNERYIGKTAEEIRELWEYDRNLGINMHKTIEDYYNKIKLTNNQLNSKEFLMFMNFEKDHIHFNSLIPFRSEWKIFDNELQIAGTIDMVYLYDNKHIILYDWKRIKVLQKFNTWQSGIVDATKHMGDCNYIHYSIQLMLYKYIIEKNYGLIVCKMYLLLLHPSQDNYIREEIKTFQPLIDAVILHRKTMIS